MLEHNAQLRKVRVDLFEVRQKQRLGVQDTHTLVSIAGNFTVQVEHHAALLHRLKDGEVHFIVLNATVAVRRHTAWIALHATYTSRRCTANLIWRNTRR